MNKAKKVFYTISAGVVVGMVLGMLFAPDKGSETRDKLRRLRDKFGCADDKDDNKRTLEELSDALKKELAMVNEKLEELS